MKNKFIFIVIISILLLSCKPTQSNFIIKYENFDETFDLWIKNVTLYPKLSFFEKNYTQDPFFELNTIHEEYFVYHLYNEYNIIYLELRNLKLIRDIVWFSIGYNDIIIIK